MGFAVVYMGNWHNVIPFFALAGLVVAGILFVTFAENKRRGGPSSHSEGSFKQDVLRNILRNPSLALVGGISGFRTSAEMAITTFLPLFAAQQLKMDTPSIGLMVGIYSLAGVVFQPVSGYLADRFGVQRVIAAFLVSAGAVMTLTALNTGAAALFVIVGVVGALSFAVRPITLALATDLVDDSMRSSSVGLVFTANQLSSAIAPIIGGVLVQTIGYQQSFVVFSLFFFMAATCALLVKKRQ